MEGIHTFYRIGIAGEKRLFENFKDTYDGVVVGAHFATFYKDWIPTFLRGLGKPFFIDPVTYVFARDLENIKKEGELKKSYDKLVKIYDESFRKIIAERQLIPRDFLKNKDLIDNIALRTLDFQKEFLKPRTPSQQSLLKYAEILGEKKTKEELRPIFLVAPYFYASSLKDAWYNISLQLAKNSLKFKEDYKLYAVICVSKEILLDEDALKRIKEDYRGFEGYLLWVSNFKEDKEGEEYLEGILKFVSLLSENKRPIYMLYGGFFSLLLYKWIKGYCRSICYGESKDVDAPLIEGGPPKRYYLPFLYTKVPEAVARAFFTDNPQLLCSCNACFDIVKEVKRVTSIKSTLGIGRFFDLMDFMKLKEHFVLTHSSEVQDILKMDLKSIVTKLGKEFEQSKRLDIDAYGIQNAHLYRWFEVLSTIF